MRLHLDTFQQIQSNIRYFVRKPELHEESQDEMYSRFNDLGENSFFYAHIASRLITPITVSLTGVAFIFKQLTRSVCSLLAGRFTEAFKDLVSVIVQTIALPLIIIGCFLSPQLVFKFFNKCSKFHENYEDAFNKNCYEKIINILFSIIVIPSIFLEHLSLVVGDAVSPRRYSDNYLANNYKNTEESLNDVLKNPTRLAEVKKSYKRIDAFTRIFCIPLSIILSILMSVRNIKESITDVCKENIAPRYNPFLTHKFIQLN